ncbi:hypothetical protein J421_1282 [Gemmatirosa kalamazoonensis]|uniref:Uncharacterized protein n=1 Tax=Gemmatirosa kalamazoonensis TaxID=861299 RepID=W0RCJ5_9BACT|nr:MBG domain-containing protein [Gemmatirosa kalamazoonensis]AHG88819.1 hypothetical protein J421_1282 [Gemmatirosa kalamazoonensis]
MRFSLSRLLSVLTAVVVYGAPVAGQQVEPPQPAQPASPALPAPSQAPDTSHLPPPPHDGRPKGPPPADSVRLAAGTSTPSSPIETAPAASTGKALVYCPPSDATGCGAIVAALSGTFPVGVERGYDGSAGTVDLASADLSRYALFVIPSLADGGAARPYDLLRSTAIAARLKDGVTGRVAVWSGTPDLGASDRPSKDRLLVGLARWAAATFETRGTTGLVALQDLSDDATTRYGWLAGISAAVVGADAALASHASVTGLTAAGEAVVGSGAPTLAYDNMASYGLTLGAGAPAGEEVAARGADGSKAVLVTYVPAAVAGVSASRAIGAFGAANLLAGVGTTTYSYAQYVTYGRGTYQLYAYAFTGTINTGSNYVTCGSMAFTDAASGAAVATGTALYASSGSPWFYAPSQAPYISSTLYPLGTYTLRAAFQPAAVGCDYQASSTTMSLIVRRGARWQSQQIDGAPTTSTYVTAGATHTVSAVALDELANAPMASSPTLVYVYEEVPNGSCWNGYYYYTCTTWQYVGQTTVNTDATGKLTYSYAIPANTTHTYIFEARTRDDDTYAGEWTYFYLYPRTATTASIGANPANGSAFGQTVAFSTTVTGAGGTPTGTVYLKVDNSYVVAQPLVNGSATLSYAGMSSGVHTVSIYYLGDATYAQTGTAGSTSQSITYTVGKATPIVTWSAPAAITYGTALSGTQLNATASVPGTFTYSPAAGTTLGVGEDQPLTVTFTPTNTTSYETVTKTVTIDVAQATQTITFAGAPASAVYGATFDVTASASSQLPVAVQASGACTASGPTVTMSAGTGTCTLTATQAGNASYAAAAPVTLTTTAARKTTAITLDASAATYDGAAHAATASTPELGAAGIAITYDGAAAAPTAAGSYAVVATLTDANYQAPNATGTLVIGKATATLTLGALSATYDGAAKAAAVTTSPAGLTGVAVTYDGASAAPSGAGSYAVVATLANPNYQATNATGTLEIGKASSTVTVTCSPASVGYDGTPKTPCTASVAGAGGLSQSLTPTYAANTNVGTATATGTFAGEANHLGSTSTATFTITKATPAIAWNAPAAITYGAALGAAQLNATASVPGSFVYSPAAGALPNAGDAQSLSVTFTPTDAANYTTATATVTIDVRKAPSVATVTCPASVTYDGTARTPCSATVTGAGNFSATPAPTYANNTNAGTATASVSYAGDANHEASSGSATFAIEKAASAVVVSCPATAVFTGAALAPCTAAANGVGGLAASLAPTYAANTNVGTATASAAFAGDANHVGSSGSATFGITKAPAAVTVSCPTAPLTYDGSAQTPCTANVAGAGGLSRSLTPAYSGNTNVGAATATAAFDGDANHDAATGSATFSIAKAPAAVTVTCASATQTYDGTPKTPCAATVTGAGGLSAAVTPVTYTANTNAGTASAGAAFAGDANHDPASGSATFTIGKAASSVAVSCPASVVYTGGALAPCTAAVSGPGTVTGAAALTYAANTNAGSASVSASYPGDANHDGSAGTGGFTIAKAPSTVTVTCTPATLTFDGTARTPCAARATGAGGLDVAVSPLTYANNTNVGAAKASAAFAGDANHDGSAGAGGFAITAAATTASLTVSPSSQQYSDQVTLTAKLSPAALGTVAPATGVTFKIAGQTVGTATLAPAAGGLVGTLVVTLGTSLPPGVKAVTADFTGVNANFTVNSASTSFTVAPEDARVTYTGATYASTAGVNSTTAAVTLSATIMDATAAAGDPAYDASAGDVRNASVRFVDRASGATLCSAPVGLVSSADTKTGTVSCNWSASLGSQESATWTVGVVVDGFYARNSADDNTVVTVALPIGGMISGGGFLVNSASGGQYAGQAGLKTNYGFNVKYNKQLTNLQGSLNVIVRNGGRTYQIKANSMTSLATDAVNTPYTAQFAAKASIQDITDPTNVIAVDGNATLQVTLTDRGSPGSNDSLGIAVFNKSGGLWFASNWNGTKTVEQTIGGGDVVVR